MSQQTMAILKECLPTFSMLADENRQTILVQLFDHGRLNVNELTDLLHLSRPAVSHHLKLLLQAGLVAVSQEGKERYYTISLAESVALLKSLIDSLEQDLHQLEQQNELR